MDTKEISDLLKLINKSNLTDVEIEKKDFKLRVQRRLPENVTYNMVPSAPQQVVAPVQPAVAAPASPAAPASDEASVEAASAAKSKEEASNLKEFNSPIIGTFYRSPSPDKASFVKVGDVVSKGQILCIIEAMKLFNEIEAEFDGKIIKILAENAQPVEYGQPLFLFEPS